MLSNFEEILCFAAVCKTGSITQAANALQCSKANVSRKISMLEKRMGAKLFQRTTRSIYLTEIGSRFQDRAVRIYDEARQLDKGTRDETGNMSGKFKITAPVSLSTFLIAPLVLQLNESFPDIEFELIPTNENVQLIESEVDLAIRTGSVVDDSLVARKLGEFHECFFTSSRNLANYKQLNIEQIARLPMLLPSSGTENDSLNLFHNGKTLSLIPTDKMRISEFEVSLNLLFNSEYIAWLPNYCNGIERSGETITPLLSSATGQPWSVFMVFPFQAPLPLKLRTIIDFIEENLSTYF